MQLLVSGSTGFVGRSLCPALCERGFSVRAISRRDCNFSSSYSFVVVPSLSSLTRYCPVFEDVQCVVHLAGRAHVMREIELDPVYAFRKVNVYETLSFAREAALAGVQRFVFVSTVKVNGECNSPDSPFREFDPVNPLDPYSLSKYEAEVGLLKISAETGMDVVIVRPPLVYGPYVKGNFLFLMKLLSSRIPLPLRQLKDNRRSLLGVDNLIDFLSTCCTHPAAAGRVFLVSDQQDVSTVDLLRRLGQAMSLNVRLFPVPLRLLESTATLFNKHTTFQRLSNSLVLDTSAAYRDLGWKPPMSLDEGLRRTALDFTQ